MDISWVFWGLFSIWMLGAIWWFRKILHQQVNAIASIVTVIGVLGTFGGIAWGLVNFDPQNIEASVPELLKALRFAFVTSIVGIFLSILLKWRVLHERQEQGEKTDTGATIDDLAETLRAIEKSLTGDGDSTVLTQLQKLRTTFSDKQDDLIDAFKDFATQMAENNTQALIKALEEVMRDFNAKINEQFGDNFKQLNEAVGRINDWQEQYRQQMDELAAEFRIAADSIEKSRQSLEIIAERSDAIVSSAEKLDPILQTLQDQIEAFSALADNARNAFPIIEGRLNQLTDDFSQAVTKTIDDSHAFMDKQREALGDQSQQLKEMVKNTSNHIQRQTEDIFQKTTSRIEEVIESTFQGLKGTLEDQSEHLKSIVIETKQGLADTLQNQSTQLETMVKNTSTRLQEMTDEFSQAVTKTIDDSHDSMDKQREALGDQSQQLKEMVKNTSNHIQRQTEDIFQKTTSRIEEVIESTFQGLKGTLEDQSEHLKSIVIETKQGLADTLQNQSTQLETMVKNTSTRLQEMTDEFSQAVTKTIDDSHDSMEDQREALQNFTGVIGDVIRSTSQEIESIVEATNRQLRTETERVFRESAGNITRQIQLLDSALETQLTKSIESLGSQLTSLSKQFVDDYGPLTDQLRNVVRIAEQLRR